MNIEDSRAKTIYRNEVNGKILYSMGLSHKKQDGSWENGYINCRFPKDADIPNKTKIMVVNAWLDFYTKDKVTHPYIFVNKYEIIEETKDKEMTLEEIGVPDNYKTEYEEKDNSVQLSDSDLPF